MADAPRLKEFHFSLKDRRNSVFTLVSLESLPLSSNSDLIFPNTPSIIVSKDLGIIFFTSKMTGKVTRAKVRCGALVFPK